MGLFCRIQSLLQGSFAKETYNFKEPTTRSHPIARNVAQRYTTTHTHTHPHVGREKEGEGEKEKMYVRERGLG